MCKSMYKDRNMRSNDEAITYLSSTHTPATNDSMHSREAEKGGKESRATTATSQDTDSASVPRKARRWQRGVKGKEKAKKEIMEERHMLVVRAGRGATTVEARSGP